MQNVGEVLKSEREKKGVSLHEVGMTLKINPKILKAIEEGDKNQLPAKTFLIGFLKSYSQYLKLNPSEILNAYHAQNTPEVAIALPETTTSVNSPEPAPQNPKPKKEEKITPLSPQIDTKKIVSIGVSLVLVIIIIFLVKIIDKYQKESHRVEVETTKPIDPAPTSPIEESALSVEPSTTDSLGGIIAATPVSEQKVNAQVTSDKKEILSSVTESSSAEKSKTEQTNELKTETKQDVVSNETAKTQPTKVESATSETTETSKPATKSTEIIIEALNKVEIKYSFDGQKYSSVVLMADQVHTFKSKSLLNLEISDGGAINIIVNGKDKGVPGTLGRQLKLSYPK